MRSNSHFPTGSSASSSALQLTCFPRFEIENGIYLSDLFFALGNYAADYFSVATI